MRQGRHGLKTFGVALLAVLGLMAISASASMAAGEFQILETENGVVKQTGTATGTAGTGKLLLASGLTIVCTAATATAKLEAAGAGTATALFSGCTVEGNKFCKVYETAAKMTAKTEAGNLVGEGTGQLHLHSGSHYLVVKGLGEKSTFSTIYTNTAAEGCTLPLENQVTGTEAFLLTTALTHAVNQVLDPITAADKTALGTLGITLGLKYGNEGATLDPAKVSNAHLTGADEGKKWGAK